MTIAARSWRWLTAIALLGLQSISTAAVSVPDSMDEIARDFVVSGLVLFHHDQSTHLYIGPKELGAAAEQRTDDLPTLAANFDSLRQRIAALPEVSDPLAMQRRRDLDDRLVALRTRSQILQGNMPSSFDEETRLIFGVEAPHYDEQHFRELVLELEALVPGAEPLSERLEVFRQQFVIPPERLESVIGAALNECRRRTLEHVDLPPDEYVSLHIAHDQPWVGFTFYRGNSHSEIHLNADVPVHIERAIELGCHEGYPGHHVHATLLEQEIVKQRGWIEYSLITLLGPQAVVAEGAASYAPDLAFSREEQIEYGRSTLMPLAGLDSARLEDYYHYVDLIAALNYARNEVARKYLYGKMPREDAVEWLMTFGLETRGTASQRLDFIDALRTYVVTYNVGRDLVSRHIKNATVGRDQHAWDRFTDLLTRPLMPHDLAP